MPRFHPPSFAEAMFAARAAVEGFDKLGYKSCYFGGLACKLYGVTRAPNDVDIVVLDAASFPGQLKFELTCTDSRFYLVRSKDPSQTYSVLWFRLTNDRSCKVDVLQPGILNIPAVDPMRIERVDGIPLLPFVVVLMLKLQGWTDHRAASKRYLQAKQRTDVTDIKELLPIAVRRGVKPREQWWIPFTLKEATERRVREFIQWFPETRDLWRELGYDQENIRVVRTVLCL